jgi:thiol-disulfide isomerase/thioredoxin
VKNKTNCLKSIFFVDNCKINSQYIINKTDSMSVILLDKDDFILLDNGQLKINHPAFSKSEGFIIFYTSWCPNCQDTKVVWSSVGYVNKDYQQSQISEYLRQQMVSLNSSIKRYPILKVVSASGIVTDYVGGQTRKKYIISRICKLANLNCGYIQRL